MLALRTKVVPLRTPSTESSGLDDLSALALHAATRPSARRELLERLEREPVLRALASKLARGLNSHGAEDLLQSTLERVVRGLASYRGEGDFLGWVSRILRNAQIALIRHEAREARRARRSRNLRQARLRAAPGQPSQSLVHRVSRWNSAASFAAPRFSMR